MKEIWIQTLLSRNQTTNKSLYFRDICGWFLDWSSLSQHAKKSFPREYLRLDNQVLAPINVASASSDAIPHGVRPGCGTQSEGVIHTGRAGEPRKPRMRYSFFE